MGALLVAAGLGPPLEHALISLLALNGLRVSEATGADIEQLGLERGHRTLTITRKGGKVVTIPLAPRTAARCTPDLAWSPPGSPGTFCDTCVTLFARVANGPAHIADDRHGDRTSDSSAATCPDALLLNRICRSVNTLRLTAIQCSPEHVLARLHPKRKPSSNRFLMMRSCVLPEQIYDCPQDKS